MTVLKQCIILLHLPQLYSALACCVILVYAAQQRLMKPGTECANEAEQAQVRCKVSVR